MAKRKPIDYPLRNYECRYYDQCLTQAALSNKLTLDCSRCKHRKDTGGKLNIDIIDRGEASACYELLTAIFKPSATKGRTKGMV